MVSLAAATFLGFVGGVAVMVLVGARLANDYADRFRRGLRF